MYECMETFEIRNYVTNRYRDAEAAVKSLPRCRERKIALERLQESQMWAGAVMERGK